MCPLPLDLDGGVLRPDGVLLNQNGEPSGFWVVPGGYLIADSTGQVVGTLTMVGRVYDSAGNLVAQIERRDIALPERYEPPDERAIG